MKRALAITLLAASISAVTTAFSPLAFADHPDSAPDAGRVFEPREVSEPVYAMREPEDAPDLQRKIVKMPDGTEIFVETWLPVDSASGQVVSNIPTVLVMSPYLWAVNPDAYTDELHMSYIHIYFQRLAKYLVERGYAYTQMHLRGTGQSTGCYDYLGSNDVDDMARVIEYLGRPETTPYTNGSIGALGLSYTGGSAIAVAGRGDPERIKYLKAIVPAAPFNSNYSYLNFDGVAYSIANETTYNFYDEYWIGMRDADRPSDQTVGRVVAEEGHPYTTEFTCHGDDDADSLDNSGNFSAYDREHEQRLYTNNITAAVLSVQGMQDVNVKPDTQVGFFDQLPATTPKTGLFGIWDHTLPDELGGRHHPNWGRADFMAMVTAWFDRYLKDLDSGVEKWPTVQIQNNEGQWHGDADWPSTGGPVGHLALGPGGLLGASQPEGSDTYVEAGYETTQGRAPETYKEYTTAPLDDRLEITGQPVLDLWVSLGLPDAHVAATLQVLDKDKQPIPWAYTGGLRSLQHLEPFVDNVFVQPAPVLPNTNEPMRVSIRFQPTDLVVPAGGYLRLTISGSQMAGPGLEGSFGAPVSLIERPSQPSGLPTPVTILHDCEYTSALRFLTPRTDIDLLDVRDLDEAVPDGDSKGGRGRPEPVEYPSVDGGGVATDPVCGRSPERLPEFGPELPYDVHGRGPMRW